MPTSVAVCREDQVSSETILSKLGIRDIRQVLQTGRIRWLGHVERSNSCIAQVRMMKVDSNGTRKTGRPKLSWEDVVVRDRISLGMIETNPHDRDEWRMRLRPR